MVADWRESTIGEHVELLTGEAFQSVRFGSTPLSGTLLARGDNIKEGRFEWGEKARYWPEVTPDLKKYFLREGDVLVGMDGSKVGKNWVQVRKKDLPCLLVQRVARLRATESLDQGFLRYLIGNPDFSSFIDRIKTGTSIPHVSGGQIKSYEVLLPPLAEQKAIASVLGALDDKIELNRRMNETLEAMPRALFQSWFVDFDPVRAKLDGRQPPGLDAATAAVFPNKFEDSEIGKKPTGWKIATLGEVLSTIQTGGRPKGGVSGITKGIPSVGAESITGVGQFDFGKTKFVPAEYYESMKKGHIRNMDVLLYKDGGRPGEYEPHVSMFGNGFPFEKCCINEHVYRLRTTERLSQEYLYFWLTSELAFAEMRAKGTGVAIPGLNSTAVRSLTVLIPPKPIVDVYTRQTSPLIFRLLANAKQSRTLASLRNAVLPKLLNGQLRIPT